MLIRMTVLVLHTGSLRQTETALNAPGQHTNRPSSHYDKGHHRRMTTGILNGQTVHLVSRSMSITTQQTILLSLFRLISRQSSRTARIDVGRFLGLDLDINATRYSIINLRLTRRPVGPLTRLTLRLHTIGSRGSYTIIGTILSIRSRTNHHR